MKRLAILSTHPIQYNAPLYRMLHEDDGIELCVFFSKTWDQVKFDPDFQREVVWDVPVSEGYPHFTYDASTKAGKKDLEGAIRNFKPDAILVYGWNFPGHLAMMRAFHGKVPIWFRGDSHTLNPIPFWKGAVRRLALRWVYRHVDMAFTVGYANEQYYLWSGLTSKQLIHAPHAVDNEFWSRDDAKRTQKAKTWRKRLNISENAPVLGFSGKLEPLKQVELLIEAVMNTQSTHLIIAGSGPLEFELKKQAAGHNRIHFLGFVNQSKMPVFYRMLDVLALVSSTETWGLCINEALACGARCLVSDRVGCHPDVLSVPSRGMKITWDGPQEWALAIESLMHLPARTNSDKEAFNATFHYGHFHRGIRAAFPS